MIENIYNKMKEHDFAPFKELKLWIIISPFGGGKESLVQKVIEQFKEKYTVHQVRSEGIKSISYMYDDKRSKLIKQLEASPLLVLVIDNNEERVRNLINPLIKYRKTQGKLTIILSELQRDDFNTFYPDLMKFGLVTQISEDNEYINLKEGVIKKYFS